MKDVWFPVVGPVGANAKVHSRRMRVSFEARAQVINRVRRLQLHVLRMFECHIHVIMQNFSRRYIKGAKIIHPVISAQKQRSKDGDILTGSIFMTQMCIITEELGGEKRNTAAYLTENQKIPHFLLVIKETRISLWGGCIQLP